MFKSLSRVIFALSLGVSSLSASEELSDAKEDPKNSSLQWKWAMESLERFPFEEGASNSSS
jgi:outer membrane protease